MVNVGKLDITDDQRKQIGKYVTDTLEGTPFLKEMFSPEVQSISEHIINLYNEKFHKKPQEKKEVQKRHEQFEQRCEYIDPGTLESSKSRTIGAEYVCHETYKELGINEILKEKNITQKQRQIIEALVVGRLVNPVSEKATHHWATELSGIFELLGVNQPYPSLNSFYNANDTLFSYKDSIEAQLHNKEKDLFDLKENLILFDLTNTYFEGTMQSNPKAQRGRSKEKRSDAKLLTLAMIIDEQGYAKFSKIFNGNQTESHTLQYMLDTLIENSNDKNFRNKTVVVDAGISSEDNLKMIRQKGLDYVVVSKNKKDFPNDILDNLETMVEGKNQKIEAKKIIEKDELKLVCRSKNKIKKEKSIRTGQEDKFLKRLEQMREGLSKPRTTKNYNKLIEMVGRLRETFPTASKYYDINVIAEKNTKKNQENLKAEDIKWEKKKIYDEQTQKEGCYVLRTNKKHLKKEEIWNIYIKLTDIEESFKVMKSHLGLRPNHHQIPQRCDTHMFISVLGYHLAHRIQVKLRKNGDNRSWASIRAVLSSHVVNTVECEGIKNGKRRRFLKRKESRPEPEHLKIYEKLGLNKKILSEKMTVI